MFLDILLCCNLLISVFSCYALVEEIDSGWPRWILLVWEFGSFESLFKVGDSSFYMSLPLYNSLSHECRVSVRNS